MAQLVVNLPNMAKGAEVEVQGLGVFENGKSYELEELEDDVVVGEPAPAKEEKKAPVKGDAKAAKDGDN